jgi:hypothetical protein
MGTTPIYGFPYPDPSDLVANYPAMGQDLAEDIEAVLPTLGGLTLITEVSPSAAGTTNITGCFSATYQQYLLVFQGTTAAGTHVSTRLRVSGTDATTNYTYSFTDTGSTVSGGRNTGNARFDLTFTNTAARVWGTYTIYNPFAAANSQIGGQGGASDAGSYNYTMSGEHAVATSYDSITFYTPASTFTGKVRIYGRKNS